MRHKALRRFIEEGKAKGLIEPGRLQDMVAFILSAPGLEALATPPISVFTPCVATEMARSP